MCDHNFLAKTLRTEIIFAANNSLLSYHHSKRVSFRKYYKMKFSFDTTRKY